MLRDPHREEDGVALEAEVEEVEGQAEGEERAEGADGGCTTWTGGVLAKNGGGKTGERQCTDKRNAVKRQAKGSEETIER